MKVIGDQLSVISPGRKAASHQLSVISQPLITAHRSLITGPRGFTLTELMVVCAIIAVLAGILVGAAGYVQRKALRSQAETEIKTMELVLERFKLDNGFFPACASTNDGRSSNIFNAVTNYMAFTPKQLSGARIIDPFGNEYYYLSPGLNNKITFDLWSAGSDGYTSNQITDATVDDIANWRQ